MTLKQLEIALERYSLSFIIENVCKEKIASGIHRDVYSIVGTNRYVLKIENNWCRKTAAFVNAMEWRNYINYREWKFLSKHLAPCHAISQDGAILLQSRIEHKDAKYYPKEIPSVFSDIKISNFGWIGKQFVACDYPFLVINPGKKSTKFVKWKK